MVSRSRSQQTDDLEPDNQELYSADGFDVAQSTLRRLYLSHFLSAWNSRFFEFGSALFLAAIYPRTLVPTSVYALARAAAAILFSPAVGRWIDIGDRLLVVRVSIVGQRAAVAASCVILYVLARLSDRDDILTRGLFAIIVILAGVEKLCSAMNSVSVTRDWVRKSTSNAFCFIDLV